VIAKKKISIDFLDGLFIGENPISTEKHPSLCRLASVKHCCPGHNLISFQPDTCSIQVSNILVLRGAYCFINHFDEFVRVAPEEQFGVCNPFTGDFDLPKQICLNGLYLFENLEQEKSFIWGVKKAKITFKAQKRNSGPKPIWWGTTRRK
jgi:hypothetical protein